MRHEEGTREGGRIVGCGRRAGRPRERVTWNTKSAEAAPYGSGKVCVYRTAEEDAPKRQVRLLVYRTELRKIERDVTLALGDKACFAFDPGHVVIEAHQPSRRTRNRLARDEACRVEFAHAFLRAHEHRVFEVWAYRHSDGGVCWHFWSGRRGGR
jgi:hypothetical protein